MKKRMIALAAALMLLVSLMPAASASFDVSTRESVVVVSTYLDLEGYEADRWSWGSGFFVGTSGQDPSNLITNNHVIAKYLEWGGGELGGFTPFINEDGQLDFVYYKNYQDERAQYVGRSKLRVYYDSGTFDEAYLVETSEPMDVAVLRLDSPTSQRKPLTLCSPTDSMVGSTVYAVGYPGLSDTIFSDSTSKWGLSDVTVTSGSISRLLTITGTGQRNIQIDCDIKPGNSGGPLVNADGAAIGLNTWTVSNSSGQSVNYAVNIDEAITLLNRNGVTYDLAGAASQPPAQEDPGDKSTQPDRSEAPDRSTPPAASSQPVVTPEPAPAPAGKDNTPLIIGGVVVAVVVVAALVLLSRRKKPAVQPVSPISPTGPAIPAGGQSGGLRLQGMSGSFAGRRFPIDRQVRIGRDPARNDLVYPANAPGVSGAHCVLTAEGGQLLLKDLGSSHGTFLNGRRLTPNQAVPVNPGDRFCLGSENETFQITVKGGV